MSADPAGAGRFDAPVWTEFPNGERHIVSRCGLFCDTCPAFLNGVCPGCPRLDPGDCVTRDCAERKKLKSCADCTLDGCFHFEAYRERRQMMRARTRRLVRRGTDPAASTSGCGGCNTKRGGSGCGSCGGCGTSEQGCPAVSQMLAALEKIGTEGKA